MLGLVSGLSAVPSAGPSAEPGGTALMQDRIPDFSRLGPRSMGLAGPCYVPDNIHGFYVVPERKLLICATEKVGLQMFADLTCSLSLAHNKSDESPKVIKTHGAEWERGCSWDSSQACGPVHNWNAANLLDAFVDPEWSRAVFYRDPLERFLSGYMSKCEDGFDPDRWICEQVFGQYNASFDQAVAMAASTSDTEFHN